MRHPNLRHAVPTVALAAALALATGAPLPASSASAAEAEAPPSATASPAPTATTATTAPSPSAPDSTADADAPAVADDRLVVGLAPDASPFEAPAIAADAGVTGAEVIDAHTMVVDAPPAGAVSPQAAELEADPRVDYVEPNFRLTSSFTPNDPAWPSLPTLFDAQPGGIRAQSAWDTTLGSRDVVVGVLDSGIDSTHPDLIGNLWSNRVGVGGCAYGTHGYNAFTKQCTSSDQYGHGTHVAGIIGAVGNNRTGITGVAPRVSLMSLAMLNRDGDGSIASAIAAINWAVTAKQRGVDVRVLSASWGGSGFSQGLADAITRAGNAGILFVAAAGNSHLDVEQDPIYPCAYELANVVCVAATRGNDRLTSFSDYGATHVDLAAPGESIVSTVPRGVIPGCGLSLYCALDGTSMAAPMVSGAAVLAVTADPTLTVGALRARLVQAVVTKPWLTGKVETGGRLDVCLAVPGCQDVDPIVAARAPSAPSRLQVVVGDSGASLAWTVPASNGNGAGITGYRVDGPAGSQVVGANVRSLTVPGPAANANGTYTVRAVNAVGEGPPISEAAHGVTGGYVADRAGRLRPVRLAGGSPPSATTAAPLGPADGQARGVAVLPDGTGGYVLDGHGKLHPFGIGGNAAPQAATGARISNASDWARGVTLMPDGTSGYVLAATGELYGFSIGDHRRPPATNNGPRWSGDVGRGVAVIPSGKGGYVVGASGEIHRFGIGGAALPVVPTGVTRWPGLSRARGIALTRGAGGGFVVDRSGGLHPFGTRGRTPEAPISGPSWPGQDQARGIAL
jgi:subtilisin family serine protease